MNRFAVIGLTLLPVFLTGCIESAYRAGAPVTDRDHASIPPLPETRSAQSPKKQPRPSRAADNQEVQIAIYTPPPRFKAKPVTSAAVSNLVQRAAEQKNRGDMTGAAATLERALRIEPRNAHLWNQLAQVRLAQRQYGQAEDLASKSNALAAADRDLRRDNWLLIAKARRSVGNLSGATLAQNQANRSR